MTAEEYITQATGSDSMISKLARELTGARVPEFSNEEITVQDASALIGLPESAIRAGILNGWLPIGVATRNGKQVSDVKSRTQFYIFPRKVWEVTGHVWRGKEALDSVHT